MSPVGGDFDRRAVLRMIAAGAAATVGACSQPDETIYPYVNQPEGMLPGTIQRYATSLPLAGYGRGVTGLVADSRPIKLEGLAEHPASLGATDLFTEIAILDLYDPQRLRAPGGPPGPSTWDGLATAIYERVAPRKGAGLALLSGRVTSPTLLARIEALRSRYPGMRHVTWEPHNDDAVLAGSERAIGRRLLPRPRLGDVDVLLTLGADPLGPGPEQVALARAWATRRRANPRPRAYALEPSMTATGTMADRRRSGDAADIVRACHAIAAALGGNVPSPDLAPDLAAFLRDAVVDLTHAKGRALILAGHNQPPDVHAFVAWANAMLEAPLDWIAPVAGDAAHGYALATLARDMHGGRVDTLVVLDANPVYAAPPELDFRGALDKVPLTVAASSFPNETADVTTWQAPLSHPLETWSDYRAPDGTASIAQPLVRPFYDTRSAIELVDLIGNPAAGANDHAHVQERWRALGQAGWKEALIRGVIPGTAAQTERVGRASLVVPEFPDTRGPSLDLRISPKLYDGRFASNAWAQECPDPITKEVWGSSARMHRADMDSMGLSDGDLVRVDRGHGAVELPARAEHGQARGVVTVFAGYGRSTSGPVASGIGANAWVLGGTGPVTLTRIDEHAPVVSTQHHFELDAELEKLFPVLGPGESTEKAEPHPTLVPPNPPNEDAPPQWAMAIDTDVCIGCNACVVACQAENNVPAIGPEQMAMGREMHWLRIDRYEVEDIAGFQPVPCMQCEKAPCEPVCPVEASVHDAQGLNVQVYNRCIGTRFCQSNCPYKVRRFNFLDYAQKADFWEETDNQASVYAQRNPDVTVRARGVMEKCTYCVQRISAATRDADAHDRPVGDVVTACQASCPTEAIRFGRLDQDGGAIEKARASDRHYTLLEELGTRPRTTYLARRVNKGGEGEA